MVIRPSMDLNLFSYALICLCVTRLWVYYINRLNSQSTGSLLYIIFILSCRLLLLAANPLVVPEALPPLPCPLLPAVVSACGVSNGSVLTLGTYVCRSPVAFAVIDAMRMAPLATR